jgi:hypothetical protein
VVFSHPRVFSFQTFGHALHEEEEKCRRNVVTLFDTRGVIDEYLFHAQLKFKFEIAVKFFNQLN